MIHLVFGVRRAERDGKKGWGAWIAAVVLEITAISPSWTKNKVRAIGVGNALPDFLKGRS